MAITTHLISVYCLIDDWLQGKQLRQRGPKPRLSDSEVLTIEVVGEFLGIDTDQGLYAFFRRFLATGFRPCARLIAPHLFARRPICGSSKSNYLPT